MESVVVGLQEFPRTVAVMKLERQHFPEEFEARTLPCLKRCDRLHTIEIKTPLSYVESFPPKLKRLVLCGVAVSIMRTIGLEELPNLPASAQYVNIANNQLEELPEMPGVRTLRASGNLLRIFTNIYPELQLLDLSHQRTNHGLSIQGLPPKLKKLYLNRCELVELPALPPKLEVLELCESSWTDDFPTFPRQLKSLKLCEISEEDYALLPAFPRTLRELDVSNTRIKRLARLPAGLEVLKASKCKMKYLGVLPQGLQELDCRRNLLRELPRMPDSLHTLDCSSNRIASLEDGRTVLGAGLKVLRMQDNPLDVIRNLPEGCFS